MGTSVKQGSVSVGNRTKPPGAPFAAGSADNGLSVDVNGVIVLGGTNLINDTTFGTDLFFFNITDGAGLQKFFAVDPILQNISLGDIGSVGNTYLQVDVINKLVDIGMEQFTVSFQGNPLLNLWHAVGVYQMGDNGPGTNGMIFRASDTARTVFMGTTVNNMSGISVDDSTGIIAVSSGIAGGAQFNMNGVPGFTGIVAPVNSITVDGGIVTNVT